MKHILSAKQFLDRSLLEKLFRTAGEMEKRDKEGKLSVECAGKIAATIFYEPSTRTRFSFETAMYKLGGNVISAESASEFSSAKKGETLEDTARVVGGYANAIIVRHPEAGAAERMASTSPVPVINAGDGSKEHPTQALLDLYTVQKELGRLDDLVITFVGDLRYSRTVHSTVYLLPLFRNVRVYCVTPPQLRLPDEYVAYLKERKIPVEESADIKAIAGKTDVLSVTRVQKERFSSEAEYDRVKNSYTIDSRVLSVLKKEAIIMHPLPRVNEIAKEVDDDVRAAYFRQTKNGVYVRMALLRSVL
ncbi:MAG: aspartate carbamoyltransferase [Minisyncoccia bacterium]|jgi:aspartate carbamoyltransferase catalytic subunit